MSHDEVRMEYLRPAAVESAMANCATLFQPLGTIEWHGLHNIVGLDAVKAHDLCVRAACQGGGLVAPPVYGGVGGLNEPHTFVMEPEESLQSRLLKQWLEQLCAEAARQGFRAMIMLTGHYGAGQQIAVRETAARMTRVLGIPILGVPEYWLALDEGYEGDHAAWGETSLMMYLRPDSVDLAQLGEEPHQGVGGKDPKQFATREDGETLTRAIVDRLAHLAQQMPKWDVAQIEAFSRAEGALVERQLTLAGQTGNQWAAWRFMGREEIHRYGQYLVDEDFEAIAGLAELL